MLVEISKNYFIETTKIYRIIYRGKHLTINDFIVVYNNNKNCKTGYEKLMKTLKEKK